MASVELDPKLPKEVRAALKSHLDPQLARLPGWVQILKVYWAQPDDPDECAATETWPEYRTVRLWIYPRFLELDDGGRRSTITHELLHAALAPMDAVFESLRAAIANENTPLATWADEEYRRACEGVVCDLTQILEGSP